jgi:hypothetical protein
MAHVEPAQSLPMPVPAPAVAVLPVDGLARALTDASDRPEGHPKGKRFKGKYGAKPAPEPWEATPYPFPRAVERALRIASTYYETLKWEGVAQARFRAVETMVGKDLSNWGMRYVVTEDAGMTLIDPGIGIPDSRRAILKALYGNFQAASNRMQLNVAYQRLGEIILAERDEIIRSELGCVPENLTGFDRFKLAHDICATGADERAAMLSHIPLRRLLKAAGTQPLGALLSALGDRSEIARRHGERMCREVNENNVQRVSERNAEVTAAHDAEVAKARAERAKLDLSPIVERQIRDDEDAKLQAKLSSVPPPILFEPYEFDCSLKEMQEAGAWRLWDRASKTAKASEKIQEWGALCDRKPSQLDLESTRIAASQAKTEEYLLQKAPCECSRTYIREQWADSVQRYDAVAAFKMKMENLP